MTYDFFADRADKIAILDFIFNETDLSIFDLGSPFGEPVSQYRNIEDVVSKFDHGSNINGETTFQLWSPRHKGEVIFRKVELNPRYCDGHTFRYATEGWGLIQLYFGGLKGNRLTRSHIGHFNEKGALQRAGEKHFNGEVAAWDWKEIKRSSAGLGRYIDKNLLVRKIGSFRVLQNADILSKGGVELL
jgi:hypothetical protein